MVRAERVGKRFNIGALQRHQSNLREALVIGGRRFAARLGALVRGEGGADGPDSIWALRDVSFEVRRGEVLGIVGTNGSGKSTLLKVLSRITEPTEGQAWIRGRVGSLLEVGTGFHWELTGRENVYLNGAILGMTREEIRRKFDEIVAFAEVERFLDTPVKHYSSGMYLRLAFAVAAHLETDILIVDEVLAVGDASFQKKCLGKMSDVAHEGRTVLFVSHNLDAVRRMCSRSLLMDEGRIALDGPTETVITTHLHRDGERPTPGVWIDLAEAERSGTGDARFAAARYRRPEGDTGAARSGEAVECSLVITSDVARSVDSLALTLYAPNGIKLVNADTSLHGRIVRLDAGENHVELRLSALHLNPGTYGVGLWLANNATGTVLDHVETAFELEVEASVGSGFGATPRSHGLVPCEWEILEAQALPRLERR